MAVLFDADRLEEDFLDSELFAEDFFFAALVFDAGDAEEEGAEGFVCEAPHTPAMKIATIAPVASRMTGYGN